VFLPTFFPITHKCKSNVVVRYLQITRDIFWFCVILLTLVVSFAQMFYTLLVPQSCASSEPGNRQCNQSEYYLKVYAILLGDFGLFQRENFTSSISVFLAVSYTFMVVLVLLNVLIAVACDSYEKCLLRSQNLFGRARIMMVAELVCFQNLLQFDKSIRANHGQNNKEASLSCYSSWTRGWSQGSLIFFALSTIVLSIWILGEMIACIKGHASPWMSLGSVTVNLTLYAAIIAFLSSSQNRTRNTAGDDGDSDRDDDDNFDDTWFGSKLVQNLMLRLLGTSATDPALEDAWNGRLLYLQREMKRISDTSWEKCRKELNGLERQRVQTSERYEALEQRVDALGKELRIALRELTRAVQESRDF